MTRSGHEQTPAKVWHETERALEAALCNFCNGVGDDPGDPASWAEETNNNFRSLCAAYNEWYSYLVRVRGDEATAR